MFWVMCVCVYTHTHTHTHTHLFTKTIQSMGGILTDATTPVQNGPESNGD